MSNYYIFEGQVKEKIKISKHELKQLQQIEINKAYCKNCNNVNICYQEGLYFNNSKECKEELKLSSKEQKEQLKKDLKAAYQYIPIYAKL